MSGTVATCPLCGDDFVDDLSYSDHLRDIHDLVDEDGAETGAHPPGAVALHADALAAAAAALARVGTDEPVALPVPEPDEPLAPPVPGPTPAEAPATSRRRRPAGLIAALALLAIVLTVGMKALSSSPGDPDVDGGDGGSGGQPVADGGIGPGSDGSLGGLTVTTTSPPTTAPPTTAPPATAPPTTAAEPPRTTAPPTPPPPPPPTTTPRPTVRAVQAAVVSCTRDGGTRTLVYRYVLSGSAADGPHEERLVARGHLVVASVRAPLVGGGSVVVDLEPGPVDCN